MRYHFSPKTSFWPQRRDFPASMDDSKCCLSGPNLPIFHPMRHKTTLCLAPRVSEIGQSIHPAKMRWVRETHFIPISSIFLWYTVSRVFNLLIHAAFWDQMSKLFIQRASNRPFGLTQRLPLRCTPNKTCSPRAQAPQKIRRFGRESPLWGNP